jgi:hypothetical protein
MISENWDEYLKNEEINYKKLGYVECPIFSHERVYFNDYGLNHLMYKDRIPRTKEEVRKRFGLLPYVSNILKNIKSVDSEEKSIRNQSIAYFWTIKHKVHDNLRVRIILRRLNNGTLHFFSIMKE